MTVPTEVNGCRTHDTLEKANKYVFFKGTTFRKEQLYGNISFVVLVQAKWVGHLTPGSLSVNLRRFLLSGHPWTSQLPDSFHLSCPSPVFLCPVPNNFQVSGRGGLWLALGLWLFSCPSSQGFPSEGPSPTR